MNADMLKDLEKWNEAKRWGSDDYPMIKNLIAMAKCTVETRERLESLRDQIGIEIEKYSYSPNIGKKGCLRRINEILSTQPECMK